MNVIRIYRGSSPAVRRQMGLLQPEVKASLKLDESSIHPVLEWSGVRAIIENYLRHLEADVISPIFSAHADVLRLIAGDLLHDFPRLQAHKTDHCGVSPFSQVAHTWSMGEVFKREVAALLHSLSNIRELTLFIPDIALLDALSRDTLVFVQSQSVRPGLEMVVGLISGREDVAVDDIDIQWYPTSRDLTGFVQSLDLVDDIQPIDLADCMATKTDDHDSAYPPRVSPLIQHSSNRLLDQLQESRTDGLLSQTLLADAVELMSRNFSAFAFLSTLRIGQAILEYAGGQDESWGQDRAKAHALMAMAAHCLRYDTYDSPGLDGFLLEHYGAALNGLDDAEWIASISYRMAMVYGRRLQQYEQALKWVDQALKSLEKLDGAACLYQRVWIHTLRFYLLDHHEPGQNAAHHLNQLIPQWVEQLQARAKNEARYQSPTGRRDIAITVSAARINYASIVAIPDARLSQLIPSDPAFTSESSSTLANYESRYWVEYYRESHYPLAGLSWACAYLSASEKLHEARYYQDANWQLAQTMYQLGYPRKTSRCLHEFMTRDRKWSSVIIEDMPSGGVLSPQAYSQILMPCIRGGMVSSAEEVLQAMQMHVPGNQLPSDAPHIALMGLIAAQRGDKKTAQNHFKHAAYLASGAFSFSLYARISTIIGCAYEALKLHHEAVAVYKNIIRNTRSASFETLTYLFPVYIRYMRLTEYDRILTHRLLSHLPLLLRERENWWYINDLLDLLAEHENKANFSVFDQNELVDLLWCASQRGDCDFSLRSLCRRLPQPMHEEAMGTLRQRYHALNVELPRNKPPPFVQQLLRRHEEMLNICTPDVQASRTVA